MLKSKIVSALALLAVAAGAQAGIPKNLNFDGYCDGMTGLVKNGNNVSGKWSNLDCAGASAALTGAQGKATGAGAKGYIMGTTGFAPLGGRELTWVVNGDGTWLVIDQGGVALNAGTWSAAVNGVKGQGTKSSTQK